jgi:hypothetical protein
MGPWGMAMGRPLLDLDYWPLGIICIYREKDIVSIPILSPCSYLAQPEISILQINHAG